MSIAQEQAANIVPPFEDAVWVQTVTTTTRAYNISDLALGGQRTGWIVLRIFADGGDVYYAFGSTTLTVDETAANAESAAVAFTSSGCDKIVSGTFVDVRINRLLHKFIALKGSASCKARIYASSEPS